MLSKFVCLAALWNWAHVVRLSSSVMESVIISHENGLTCEKAGGLLKWHATCHCTYWSVTKVVKKIHNSWNFMDEHLKAESHCSDNDNDNDQDAKRTHSIGWIAPRRIRKCSFNQWTAFSLRRYRSCYRCSGTGPLHDAIVCNLS